jgi:hypothetical protein
MRRRHGSKREAADTGLNTWSHLTNCRRTYEAATARRGIAAVLAFVLFTTINGCSTDNAIAASESSSPRSQEPLTGLLNVAQPEQPKRKVSK